MRFKLKLLLAITMVTFPLITFSQQSSGWTKWTKLIGNWVGEGEGKPGQGNIYLHLNPIWIIKS